ncbi:MAG: molybdopterin molybdotransferase MoeA [Cytophagales bacterium]|nr:molybdopterin molybdotransferase MoeA [Cytophagales bacterium]
MISVQEAAALIGSSAGAARVSRVGLAEAVGGMLREPVYADRDFPPFHRATMDGIAVAFAALQSGPRTLPVAGTVYAGTPPMRLTDPGTCLEIMTGAVLPEGADTVIRYEDLQLEEGPGGRRATPRLLPEKPWHNVHRRGTDGRQGDLLIPAGTRLGPAEIGVAASVGRGTLAVSGPLRVAVVSTGDELVEVDQSPLPHQIRRSNAHMLGAALREAGATPALFHVPDDKPAIRRTLEGILPAHDCLVLSGGVSMGKSDFVPEVLGELGVERLFHKVAQRPGKPFWFGRSAEGVAVFAFPGNPVSTFLCCYRYLVPWLRAVLGQPPLPAACAVLDETIRFTPPLTYFVPVRTYQNAQGVVCAKPLPGSGSGDFANLLHADAFLELDAGTDTFPAGGAFPLVRFRS